MPAGLASLRDDRIDARALQIEGLVDGRRRAHREDSPPLDRVDRRSRERSEGEAEHRGATLEYRGELLGELALHRRQGRRRQAELREEGRDAGQRWTRVRRELR